MTKRGQRGALIVLVVMLVSLVLSACERPQQGSPMAATKSAFQVWAEQVGMPYRDDQYSLTTNDGTFASVHVVAWFRESMDSPWLENQAEVECRKVGGKWLASDSFDFELTQAEQKRQNATATAVAMAQDGTATAVAVAQDATATAIAAAQDATATALTLSQSATSESIARAAETSTAEAIDKQAADIYKKATIAYDSGDKWLAAYYFQRVAGLQPKYLDVDVKLQELLPQVGRIYYTDDGGLSVMPSIGGIAERISCGIEPTLSADGTLIAFMDCSNQFLTGPVGGPYRSFKPLPDGLTWPERELPLDIELSPDGSKVAIVAYQTMFFLSILDLRTGQFADMTGDRAVEAWGVDWSPDGSKLCVAGFVRGAFVKDVLLVINSDGSHQTHLKEVDGGFVSDCSWSPDGQEIAYIWQQSWERFYLNVISPTGKDDHNLAGISRSTSERMRSLGTVQWSPDGQKIAYLELDDSWLEPGASGRLYVMDPNGSNRVEVSDGIRDFTWAP